nr:hypothetical protein StreXyl84_79790 [Streptomyces sp. Xyl84]
MKKTLAVVSLALATAVSLAAPAAADPGDTTPPGDTPALGCNLPGPVQGLSLVDLPSPPLGYPVEQVKEEARKLGLPGVPTVIGAGCSTPQPTNLVDGTHEYRGSGPVILRMGGQSSTQQYCLNSVSVLEQMGRAVIGSDCHLQANPIVVP